MATLLRDVAHWKERADDARRVAMELADDESRKHMLEIADNYDRLAARAQLRAQSDKKITPGTPG